MALTPVQDGTWILPCLSCGRLLDYEIVNDIVECDCGIKYLQEELAQYRAPGHWRQWIAAFACTCGKVYVAGDTIEIKRHRCRMGEVSTPHRN